MSSSDIPTSNHNNILINPKPNTNLNSIKEENCNEAKITGVKVSCNNGELRRSPIKNLSKTTPTLPPPQPEPPPPLIQANSEEENNSEYEPIKKESLRLVRISRQNKSIVSVQDKPIDKNEKNCNRSCDGVGGDTVLSVTVTTTAAVLSSNTSSTPSQLKNISSTNVTDSFYSSVSNKELTFLSSSKPIRNTKNKCVVNNTSTTDTNNVQTTIVSSSVFSGDKKITSASISAPVTSVGKAVVSSSSPSKEIITETNCLTTPVVSTLSICSKADNKLSAVSNDSFSSKSNKPISSNSDKGSSVQIHPSNSQISTTVSSINECIKISSPGSSPSIQTHSELPNQIDLPVSSKTVKSLIQSSNNVSNVNITKAVVSNSKPAEIFKVESVSADNSKVSKCNTPIIQCTKSSTVIPICDSSRFLSKCIISPCVVSKCNNLPNSINKSTENSSQIKENNISKSTNSDIITDTKSIKCLSTPVNSFSKCNSNPSELVSCSSITKTYDKLINSALTVSVTSVTTVPRVSTSPCVSVAKTNVRVSKEDNPPNSVISTPCSSSGSLEVAGVVSGRAVTITATSGPAPQGNTRVASPPSVSITAVVRNSIGNQQNSSESVLSTHHHEGTPSSHYQGVQQQQVPAPSHSFHQHSLSHSSSSVVSASRMDQCDGSSDSGVSVTERSVSRSSVLSDDRSSSAEVKSNTPTPTTASIHSKTYQTAGITPLVVDRKESVRVWRDPALVSQSEQTVRHIHSLQHSNMSQHYAGVPPHHSVPPGSQSSSHAPSHQSHVPPPSAAPLSHGLPPGLPYPHHAPPPLHMTHGLQPPINPALYPQLLPHVSPLPHYAGLIPHHQDEMLAREMERERTLR